MFSPVAVRQWRIRAGFSRLVEMLQVKGRRLLSAGENRSGKRRGAAGLKLDRFECGKGWILGADAVGGVKSAKSVL
jgi:hypothetical protein